jgi:hypothetical protein
MTSHIPTKTILLLGFITAVLLFPRPARATITCESSVDRTTPIPQGTTLTLNFSIANTGSGSINWVEISIPSGNYTISSGSLDDFPTVETSQSTITFSNGSSNATTAHINVTTGPDDTGAENWPIRVAESPDGNYAVNCSGALSTSISGPPPDTTPPTISNVVISGVTDTSVIISFTTNEACTGTVSYGKTNGYGTTTPVSASSTSQSFNLTSLDSNTTYHFKTDCTDASNNGGETADATFATAKKGQTGQTVTVTVTNTTTQTVTKVIIATPPPDITPPNITLKTDLAKPVDHAPKIEGEATDNTAVSKVEYSADGGKNWLPVDQSANAGTKLVSFAFVPSVFDDGIYKLKIRATDSSGNVGYSPIFNLTYDRLPPTPGSAIFALGIQPLLSDLHGRITTLADTDTRIVLSAIGGPTSINLMNDRNATVSALTKNPEVGLWSGTFRLPAGGTTLRAIAQNSLAIQTVTRLASVDAVAGGIIKSDHGNANGAIVTLWRRDEDSGQFTRWNGAPYNQVNPQTISVDHSFAYFVASGQYYLSINYDNNIYQTRIITFLRSGIINPDITLHQPGRINLGPYSFTVPNFLAKEATITPQSSAGIATSPEMLLNTDFILTSTLPALTASIARGQVTLLTGLTSWLPSAAQQAAVLDRFTKQNPLVATEVIFFQQSQSTADIFRNRAGMAVPVIADPDGTLPKNLSATVLPVHLVLDKHGIVKNVTYGVMSEEDLGKLVDDAGK